MGKSKDREIIVTHNNNYYMVAIAFWVFAAVSLCTQFFSNNKLFSENLLFSVVLPAGFVIAGFLALFSRSRWSLRLTGDTLYYCPVFGHEKMYELHAMEYRITDTKFNDLSNRMQRELGMSGPQATIEVSQGGKVVCSISHTDRGFLEFYKRLKHEQVRVKQA